MADLIAQGADLQHRWRRQLAVGESQVRNVEALVKQDPAVASVMTFTGGFAGATNVGRMFVMLKPLEERQISADQVIARLRPKVARVTGARLSMQVPQDLRMGGRLSSAQYQFTLQGDDVRELNEWGPQVLNRLRRLSELTDVNSDQQDKGLEAMLVIDRDTRAVEVFRLAGERFERAPFDVDGAVTSDVLGVRLASIHGRLRLADAFDPAVAAEI